MDEPDYNGVPVVVLESLRIRLSQLVHSLTNLSGRVQAAELSAWPALQQQFNVVLLQLSSLASTLSSFAPTLQRCVAYPMPNFPFKSNSWLLATLLRKKTLPEVDEWVDKGVERGQGINTQQDDDFCEWALEAANSLDLMGSGGESFSPKPEPAGWNIDKVVGFMSGKSIQ